MEMFRCPTCLHLLQGGEQRCPACRTRLRKRSRPIVLGETARITARMPYLAERDAREREREVQARAMATTAEDERRRRVANAIEREDTGRVAVLVFTPEPEPQGLEARLMWAPDPPATDPIIDLTAEPDVDTLENDTPEADPPAMDVHEMFEALHRKARGERDAGPFPIAAAKKRAAGPQPARVPVSRPEGRREWSLEVGRRAEGNNDDV
jgi:hypothetical protein